MINIFKAFDNKKDSRAKFTEIVYRMHGREFKKPSRWEYSEF